MKKICSIILLLALTLSGCTFSTSKNQDPKDTSKVEQNNSVNSDYLFNKKKECSNLSSDINKELEKERDFNDGFHIEQIFYSPSKNSCLYAFYKTHQFVDQKTKIEDEWRWYIINDFLTKEMVWTSKIIRMNQDGLEFHDLKEQQFQDEIQQLKK